MPFFQDQILKGVESLEVKHSENIDYCTLFSPLFWICFSALFSPLFWICFSAKFLPKDLLKYEPGREYVAYKDAQKSKVYTREKRTVSKEMASHGKILQFLKDQNKQFSGYIKATTEVKKDI